MNMTPEFNAARIECLRLNELLGTDHPQTIKALQFSMTLAPEEIHQAMREKMGKLGLLPELDSFIAAGSLMHRIDDIAAIHDITIEEAEQSMCDMLVEKKTAGMIVTYGSLPYRRQ